VDGLEDRDEEALEALVLGTFELVTDRAREAALREELPQPAEEELHLLPEAAGRVGDAAEVALEGVAQRHERADEQRHDARGRQDGREEPAHREADRLEADAEERERPARGDDRAGDREERSRADDDAGDRLLHGHRQVLDDAEHGVQGVGEPANDRLQHLRERLAEDDGEGLERALEERLLPLERVEQLLAEAGGRAARALHLFAKRSDGLGALERHLAAVAGRREGGVHDGVEREQPAGAEGGHDAAVALGLAHPAGRLREVGHDVDHRAHLAGGRIEDGDAGTEDRLLRSAFGPHAAHGLAEGGRGRRRVDVAVAQQPHRDEDVVERLAEDGPRGGGLREARLEVAGLEVRELGRAEQLVRDARGLVRREPVGVERADDRLGRLLDTDLAERARREVEHGEQRLRGLERRLAGGRERRETAHRLVRRELRRDAGLDGGVAQHAHVVGGRGRDRADAGEALLEAARGVREREGAGDHPRPGREHAEADPEPAEGAGHPVRAARHALVEAAEATLEPGHLRRREVARREDEAEPEVAVQTHRLPPPRRLPERLRFPAPLLVDAPEQPVAFPRVEVERVAPGDPEPRAAVLAPAEPEQPLAPVVLGYGREEPPLRARFRAVRPFPGRKKLRSKGSSTA